jgi:hypothetical protein
LWGDAPAATAEKARRGFDIVENSRSNGSSAKRGKHLAAGKLFMASLSHLTVSPDGVAFNPTNGDTFILNKSGLAILKILQAGGGEPEAAQALTELYLVPLEQAQHDVVDFQGRLRSFGLL